jgi:virulence-associated protein VapD
MANKKKQQDKPKQSSQEQRVAQQLKTAQESVDAALADLSINRLKLADKLNALADQFEARTKLAIYQEAAKSIRAMIPQLGFENYQEVLEAKELVAQVLMTQSVVKKALTNDDILRTILALDIEEMAKFFGQDAPEDSPNFIISSQLRALIPQLDLEHYTASHAETSLLTFLTYAPEQVQVALNDPDVDRYPLVKQLVYTLGILDQDIVKGTPYPMLVEQIHMWLESLGTELAERAEDERYADDILAQAQQLVEQALTEPKTKRKSLARELEANAKHFEEDEPEGSTYYILAEQLRALIKKLEAE